jgi:hypothetical protein
MGMALWAEYIDGIAVVDVGTATFTAVDSTAEGYSSKVPVDEGWFEKNASNEYVLSHDTTVGAGKTYYTRTVSAGA